MTHTQNHDIISMKTKVKSTLLPRPLASGLPWALLWAGTVPGLVDGKASERGEVEPER